MSLKNVNHQKRSFTWSMEKPSAKDYFLTVFIFAVCTLIGLLFQKLDFTDTNIVTIYILGVLLTSIVTDGYLCSVAGSFLSVFLFCFFLTEPRMSFKTYAVGYPVTFFIMLISSVLTGALAAKLKTHAKLSTQLAFRTQILFDTDRLLQREKGENNMKSVMISIKPYWVFLIIAKTMGWNIDKEKTVEVRKTYPQDDEWNKVGKIYCTKDKKSFNHIPKKYQPFMKRFLGKVIGEFVCDRIDTIRKRGIDDNFDYCYLSLDKWGNDDIEPEITAVKNSCVLRDDLNDYGKNSRMLYGWHISNLKIYDEPKELSEFYKKDFKKALCYWEYLFSIDCVDDEPEPKEEDYILTKAPQSWCYAIKVN